MDNQEMFSITIDGPASVGKSTISKMLAKKLGWFLLETGALYRAITVDMLIKEINVTNEQDVIKEVGNIKLDVQYISGEQHVFVNDKDFTSLLRKSEVEKNVALVSKIHEVRECVRAVQRKIASQNKIVIEGRDIGTVVLKNSMNKFFLTASLEVRAKRRYVESLQKNQNVDYYEIFNDIKTRDELDRKRKESPLIPAKNAIVIDTSDLSILEVVDMILSKIKIENKKNEKKDTKKKKPELTL